MFGVSGYLTNPKQKTCKKLRYFFYIFEFLFYDFGFGRCHKIALNWVNDWFLFCLSEILWSPMSCRFLGSILSACHRWHIYPNWSDWTCLYRLYRIFDHKTYYHVFSFVHSDSNIHSFVLGLVCISFIGKFMIVLALLYLDNMFWELFFEGIFLYFFCFGLYILSFSFCSFTLEEIY